MCRFVGRREFYGFLSDAFLGFGIFIKGIVLLVSIKPGGFCEYSWMS
jgi:hypothetical protein